MIRHLTSFLICCALCLSACAQKPAPVGVQLYSFREQFAKDVPGTMKKVQAMGFRYVETAGFYGMDVPAFRKMLDDHGLHAVSTGADFDELQDPSKLTAVIRNAKTLGAKFVTCFWIPHNGDEFTVADVERAVEVFNKAGKTLRDNGLRFQYHAHGFEFRPHGSGLLFDLLAQKTDPKYVNFQMDVFWVNHPGQDPVALLKKYPGRWLSFHLKDRRKGTPGNANGHADVETNVVLGQGDINIAGVLTQAKKDKIKYFFIEDESSRSLDQVPHSIGYLRKHM